VLTKSTASVALPTWFPSLKPSGHAIAASYGQDLAIIPGASLWLIRDYDDIERLIATIVRRPSQ
jgi:hypothetical protein